VGATPVGVGLGAALEEELGVGAGVVEGAPIGGAKVVPGGIPWALSAQTGEVDGALVHWPGQQIEAEPALLKHCMRRQEALRKLSFMKRKRGKTERKKVIFYQKPCPQSMSGCQWGFFVGGKCSVEGLEINSKNLFLELFDGRNMEGTNGVG
jgi:hypothetical protein